MSSSYQILKLCRRSSRLNIDVVLILGVNNQGVKSRGYVAFSGSVINTQSDFPAGVDSLKVLRSTLDDYSVRYRDALTQATVHSEWSGKKESVMGRHLIERLLRPGAEPDRIHLLQHTMFTAYYVAPGYSNKSFAEYG